ncbi:hypothetical protein P43SY_006807 [Pythium insidiosum]|uniref:M96 mating-specific protein family n=1 Tax=Pythium insidiosum TaxID=114742 RepID=A0AAD5M410_PYTIN|nr:hypothetical protein P43SY_006807 [Pythium insidiosum]
MEVETEAIFALLDSFPPADELPSVILDSLTDSDNDSMDQEALPSPRVPMPSPGQRSVSPVFAIGPSGVAKSTTAMPSRKGRGCPVKRELEQLREMERELEAQLELLQSRADSVAEQQRTGSGPPSQATGILQNLPSLWKHVAVRQFQHRRVSESENIRLRTAVTEQLRVIQSLTKALQKAEQSTRISDKASLNDMIIPASGFDLTLCCELLCIVERMGADVSGIFTPAHFAKLDESFQEIENAGSLGSVTGWTTPAVAVVESRVVPFSPAAVFEIVWREHASLLQSRKPLQFDMLLEVMDDTSMSSFQFLLQDRRPAIPFEVTFVARRRVIDDMFVLMWSAEIRPAFRLPILGSVKFRSLGWNVMRPIVGPTGDVGTQILTRNVMVPSVSLPLTDRNQQWNEWIHMVARNSTRRHEWILQHIEDAFLVGPMRKTC